jgi:transposase
MMILSREEKEKKVLDLYYNKGYIYRQIAKELRMSPNHINKIIKRHEEKNEAIANKKKMLSLSSQAYKLFSEGKTNVQVAIKLDLPQEQITQFRLEYWRLQNQDELESLYMLVKGKISVLWKIYKELMIMWGMTIEEVASALNVSLPLQLARLYRELVRREISIEEIAAVVDIALNKLPDMKQMLEETTKAVARKQLELNMLETRISSLKEEENRRRNRIFTLPSSSYRYVENRDLATNPLSYHSDPTSTPSSLPYWSSRDRDL